MDFSPEMRKFAAECGLSEYKLPTEDQLHEYLSHLEALTCSPEDRPSLNKVIQSAKSDGPVPMEDIWIGSSFPDKLAPKPLPVIGGADAGISPRWRGNWRTRGRAKIPAAQVTATVLPPDIFNLQTILDPRSFHPHNTELSSGGSIYSIPYGASSAHDNFRTAQQTMFLEELKEKGYVARRPIPELIQEVRTRRTQFPKTKIYVFLGSDISYYFNGMHDSKYWEEAALIDITSERYYRPGNQARVLAPFETAVISEAQMNASHSFEFYYHLERIPRWWIVNSAYLMRFTTVIAPHSPKEKVIREPVKEIDSRFMYISEET